MLSAIAPDHICVHPDAAGRGAATAGFGIDATVGTGIPGSCTESALVTAINQVQSDIEGGTVFFNCGVFPTAVIPSSSQKLLTGVIAIDGGNGWNRTGRA